MLPARLLRHRQVRVASDAPFDFDQGHICWQLDRGGECAGDSKAEREQIFSGNARIVATVTPHSVLRLGPGNP